MRRTLLALGISLTILAVGAPAAFAQQAHVLPATAQPHGATYAEWAARWWRWALTQPPDVNPLLDPTGEHCASGQSGHVWFLGGPAPTESGTVTVNRACTIPTGTALFFPIVNAFYCADPGEPPERRTEQYVRSQVDSVEDAAQNLSATINGLAVTDLRRYFEESVLFSIDLPANNIFGAPAGIYEPCADAGYYLFVPPLPVGEHTIHFTGTLAGLSLDVIYQITVAPRAAL
jgi:hypothetical protein